jgi:hypothetical protein
LAGDIDHSFIIWICLSQNHNQETSCQVVWNRRVRWGNRRCRW